MTATTVTAGAGPNNDPKHAARATRTAGREMRSRLLDAASRLFKERGLSGTSIAAIAAAADAFPSQITYYFRTKEALFVEAACRDVLYVARTAEQVAQRAWTSQDYSLALVESVMRADGVGFFVQAMTLTRRRQDLAPLVERTIERLHSEGLRAHLAAMQAHGWRSIQESAVIARRFWTLAVGVTLEGHAMGRSTDRLISDLLELLEPEVDAGDGKGKCPHRLRLAAGETPVAESPHPGRSKAETKP